MYFFLFFNNFTSSMTTPANSKIVVVSEKYSMMETETERGHKRGSHQRKLALQQQKMKNMYKT